MKHQDKVALLEILKNSTKEKALDELINFAQTFDKTLQQRSKELYKKDKEMTKVAIKKKI